MADLFQMYAGALKHRAVKAGNGESGNTRFLTHPGTSQPGLYADAAPAMLIVYSAVLRRHRPAYVVRGGHPSQSCGLPERLDSILSAVKATELGAVIEPAHSGLAPILAVHDAGMIEYLQDAYAQHPSLARDLGRF